MNTSKMWTTSDKNVCWLFETNHWWQFGTFQISIISSFPVVILTSSVTEYFFHENVPLVVRIILSFPHSWFITVFVTRLSRRLPVMKHYVISLSQHTPEFSLSLCRLCVAQPSVLCIAFCSSLLVLFRLVTALYVLPFKQFHFLVTPLLSSDFV
jgi:hypothetical protein